MSGKKPSFQFYPGDWLKDPKLSKCGAETRGIWIDLICAMHEEDRSGIIEGTAGQLARLCRCTTEEMERAIQELKETETATVTLRHEKIQICNRRMYKNHRDRTNAVKRSRAYRYKISQQQNMGTSQTRHKNITPPSSSSSSTSVKYIRDARAKTSKSETANTPSKQGAKQEPEHEGIAKMKALGYKRIFKMEEPLTGDELDRLKKEFSVNELKETFDDMENYKKLLSNNVSANKTARNWLRRKKQQANNGPTTKTNYEFFD